MGGTLEKVDLRARAQLAREQAEHYRLLALKDQNADLRERPLSLAESYENIYRKLQKQIGGRW